jgi:hypothetical protein
LKVRPLAICKADFPDDSVATEDGKGFLDHGGHNVADAIAEILSHLGCTVSPRENAAEYGWRFDWDFNGETFLCQVSAIPPGYYLHFEGAALDRSFSPDVPPPHARIMAALNDALARDGRFHDICWYPSIGGTVRLDDAMAATDPLAPPPFRRSSRLARHVLLLVGCLLILEAMVSIADGALLNGVLNLLLGAMFFVFASGVLEGRWPWPTPQSTRRRAGNPPT